MASTTALPPPTSIEQCKRPATSSAGCFCCKACAGRIVCRLFYCKACAGRSSAGCFAARPMPVVHLPAVLLQGLCRSASPAGPFCYNGLVLPCHALSACLCLPLPAFALAPCPLPLLHLPIFIHYHVRQDHRVCCRDCPVGSRITGLHWQPVHRVFHPSIPCLCLLAPGSSRVLQGLPCRQPHHGTALAARAPCVPSIHPSHIACVCSSQNHHAFCRDCLVGSRITGLHWRPVHRLCSLRSFQRGWPRTACEQPATFPVTCMIS